MVVPAQQRWAAKVRFGTSPGACWEWTATRNNRGHGMFVVTTDLHVLAHRWAYEQEVGPIPPGFIIIHSCDTPSCVNPAHLRLGTRADNHNSQKTHCLRGHLFAGDNLRVRPNGQRVCRSCANARQKKARRLKAAQ